MRTVTEVLQSTAADGLYADLCRLCDISLYIDNI